MTPNSWSTELVVPRQKRRFSIVDANRTLPLVRRIVADIVRTHEQAARLHSQLNIKTIPAKREAIEQALEANVDRIRDFVDELEQIGCRIRDCRNGLVDFTARHQGRDILLVWKLGEDEVEFWSEIHADFDDRKPIAAMGV